MGGVNSRNKYEKKRDTRKNESTSVKQEQVDESSEPGLLLRCPKRQIPSREEVFRESPSENSQ